MGTLRFSWSVTLRQLVIDVSCMVACTAGRVDERKPCTDIVETSFCGPHSVRIRTIKICKARFPLLTGDRFPLPVNTGRVDGRAFPLAELMGRVDRRLPC